MVNFFPTSSVLSLLLTSQSNLPLCEAFTRIPSAPLQSSIVTTTVTFAAQSETLSSNECQPKGSMSLSEQNEISNRSSSSCPRRSFLSDVTRISGVAAFTSMMMGTSPLEAGAAVDCFADCLKNCKLIAPKVFVQSLCSMGVNDPEYCQSNCKEYCDQPDRTDGLSGSISSTGGETGILGTSTVVKGEDKPPQVKLPGLDFTSDKGKKLIGY
ncbi:hypothetical protein ACHAXS_012337 [Conticribra weissflogii]